MFRTNVRFAICLMLICLTAAVVPASAQHFKEITGTPLSQIAVGRKEVWGLYNSRVYRFKSNTESFDQIPGALTQIAVGGGTLLQSDEVWGINASGEIYRFDFTTKTLVQVPGALTQIAVGGAAGYGDNCHPYEVWGINSPNVYRYNYCYSQFESVPNAGGLGNFTQIAVGPIGDVWGLWQGTSYNDYAAGSIVFEYTPWDANSVNGVEQVWRICNGCNSGYGPTQPVFTWQQITVGTNQAWVVDSFGAIWFWAPSLNIAHSGPGVGIDIYGIDNTQTSFPYAPQVTQIACGGDGVWFISSGGHMGHLVPGVVSYLDEEPPAGADAPAQIAVGSGAGVWMIDVSDQVYVWVRP
jgi:Tectonin domain